MGSDEKPTTWRPSAIRVLMMDYVAFIGVGVAIVPAIILLGAHIGLLGEQTDQDLLFWLMAAFVGLLAGPSIFLLRVRAVSRFYERAAEVPGEIVKVWFVKDRGRVEYSYTFRGQRYVYGKAVMKTRRTESLQSGYSVIVIVDPENPKKSLIRDLYA